MTKIQLNKKDVDAINTALDKFPDVDNFNLIYTNASGIGYTVDLEIKAYVNGVLGTFIIQTTGVEDW